MVKKKREKEEYLVLNKSGKLDIQEMELLLRLERKTIYRHIGKYQYSYTGKRFNFPSCIPGMFKTWYLKDILVWLGIKKEEDKLGLKEMQVVERFKTVRETSYILNCSEEWIRILARKGKLKGYKIGKQWRFLREDIEALLEEH